jgi:hypothetical protein
LATPNLYHKKFSWGCFEKKWRTCIFFWGRTFVWGRFEKNCYPWTLPWGAMDKEGVFGKKHALMQRLVLRIFLRILLIICYCTANGFWKDLYFQKEFKKIARIFEKNFWPSFGMAISLFWTKLANSFCWGFLNWQMIWFGGARRDRTADLYNAIVALSQLSYDPKTSSIVSLFLPAFNPPAAKALWVFTAAIFWLGLGGLVLDWLGLDWLGLDWFGFDWFGLSELGFGRCAG